MRTSTWAGGPPGGPLVMWPNRQSLGGREVFLRISQDISRYLKIQSFYMFLQVSAGFYCWSWRSFSRRWIAFVGCPWGFVHSRTEAPLSSATIEANRYWGFNQGSTTSWKPWLEAILQTWVKTWYPFCEHQNSWVKMVFMGFMDAHPPILMAIFMIYGCSFPYMNGMKS